MIIYNFKKYLTILTGKDWCFIQFSTGVAGQLLLIFLTCLHNQLSSIFSIISADVFRQIDSKNGWLLLSASFTANFGLVFV